MKQHALFNSYRKAIFVQILSNTIINNRTSGQEAKHLSLFQCLKKFLYYKTKIIISGSFLTYTEIYFIQNTSFRCKKKKTKKN